MPWYRNCLVLVAAYTNEVFASIKTHNLGVGMMRFKSDTAVYYVIEQIGSRSMYTVSAEYFIPTSRATRLVVKCGPITDIDGEWDFARNHKQYSWCVEVFEKVLYPGSDHMVCYAMEYVEGLDMDNVSMARRFSIGLKMLDITEEMHTKLSVGHRDTVLGNWMVSGDSLVLLGLHAVKDLRKDPAGYHRILELQQIVLNLVNGSSRRRMTSEEVKMLVSNSGNQLDPALAKLVQYAFSVSPENGHVPSKMYSTIRNLLLDGLYSDEDSLPFWMREIPGELRKSVVQVPRPDQVDVHPVLIDSSGRKIEFEFVWAHGTSGLIYSALCETDEMIALKCREFVGEEATFLRMLLDEEWAPRFLGTVEYAAHSPPLTCLKLRLEDGNLLEEISSIVESPHAMLELVRTLWRIVRDLHLKHMIVHGNIQVSHWLDRGDRRWVLADYSRASHVEDDHSGSKRLKDIAQLTSMLKKIFDCHNRSCPSELHRMDFYLDTVTIVDHAVYKLIDSLLDM